MSEHQNEFPRTPMRKAWEGRPKIDELRMLVRDALKECNPSATPNMYELIQTVDGYKKAEDMVINYAIKNQVSVSAAVSLLEAEYEME